MSNGIKGAAALCVVAGVAGCGGGDSAPPTFADYEDAQTELAVAATLEAPTSEASLPIADSARYDGFLSGAVEVAGRRDVDVIGELGLNVNFGTNTVSGDVTNVLGEDSQGDAVAYTGSLTVEDGQLGRGITAGIVSADATGDLTDQDGRTIGLDLDLLGALRGGTAQYVSGTATGDVSAVDGTGAPVTASWSQGVFVAER